MGQLKLAGNLHNSSRTKGPTKSKESSQLGQFGSNNVARCDQAWNAETLTRDQPGFSNEDRSNKDTVQDVRFAGLDGSLGNDTIRRDMKEKSLHAKNMQRTQYINYPNLNRDIIFQANGSNTPSSLSKHQLENPPEPPDHLSGKLMNPDTVQARVNSSDMMETLMSQVEETPPNRVEY